MSFLHVNFTDADTQIAHFARAIALPIRVFIIRMIAQNGNAINKQTFYNNAFDARAINKHILELKALGIIKVKTVKAQVTYYIDQPTFEKMSAQFGALFYQQPPLQPAPQTLNNMQPERNENSPDAPNFGGYIKQHRTELNLSQENLANKLEIDRALLSRIECGRKPISAAKLPLLAQALYISIEELNDVFELYRRGC